MQRCNFSVPYPRHSPHERQPKTSHPDRMKTRSVPAIVRTKGLVSSSPFSSFIHEHHRSSPDPFSSSSNARQRLRRHQHGGCFPYNRPLERRARSLQCPRCIPSISGEKPVLRSLGAPKECILGRNLGETLTVVARAMSSPTTIRPRDVSRTAAAMFGRSTVTSVTSHDNTLAMMSVHRFHKDWRIDLVDSSL